MDRLIRQTHSAPINPFASATAFSLVSVLVAIALSGVVAAVLSEIYTKGFQAQRSIEMRSDLDSIRNAIKLTIDCSETVNALCKGGTCKAGNLPVCPTSPSFIDVYKKSKSGKTILIEEDGTLFGKWTVRAECTSSGIDVSAGRLKSGRSITASKSTDFEYDPLTHAAQDFALKRNRLFDGASKTQLCQAEFLGNGRPPGFNVQYYSTPGDTTFTVPAGVYFLKVETWGGGGAGCGGRGGGGGGGGYAQCIVETSPDSEFTVTVGGGQVYAGIHTGSYNGCAVGEGETSSFVGSGVKCWAAGGRNGSGGGGVGGAAGGGVISRSGGWGGDLFGDTQGVSGGSASYGGAGGNPPGSVAPATSGPSQGGAFDGQAPGGGGAATFDMNNNSGVTGGNGADGAVLVTY